jgi:hypothetical protein
VAVGVVVALDEGGTLCPRRQFQSVAGMRGRISTS